MELKKEEVYIYLRGMSKEELTELYWLLRDCGEKMYRGDLNSFLGYPDTSELLNFYCNVWCGYTDSYIPNKTKVTLTELKNILQYTNTLQQQLEKAKSEVERIEKLIEEESKPKVGDWGKFWDDGNNGNKIISKLRNIYDDPFDRYETEIEYTFECFEKITNQKLIELLENEI